MLERRRRHEKERSRLWTLTNCRWKNKRKYVEGIWKRNGKRQLTNRKLIHKVSEDLRLQRRARKRLEQENDTTDDSTTMETKLSRRKHEVTNNKERQHEESENKTKPDKARGELAECDGITMEMIQNLGKRRTEISTAKFRKVWNTGEGLDECRKGNTRRGIPRIATITED